MIGQEPDEETIQKAHDYAISNMRSRFEDIGLGDDRLAKIGKSFLRVKETKFFKIKGCVLRGQENDLLAPGIRVLASTPDETLVAIDVHNKDLQLKTWIEINRLKGNYVERVMNEDKGIEAILREIHGKKRSSKGNKA